MRQITLHAEKALWKKTKKGKKGTEWKEKLDQIFLRKVLKKILTGNPKMISEEQNRYWVSCCFSFREERLQNEKEGYFCKLIWKDWKSKLTWQKTNVVCVSVSPFFKLWRKWDSKKPLVASLILLVLQLKISGRQKRVRAKDEHRKPKETRGTLFQCIEAPVELSAWSQMMLKLRSSIALEKKKTYFSHSGVPGNRKAEWIVTEVHHKGMFYCYMRHWRNIRYFWKVLALFFMDRFC